MEPTVIATHLVNDNFFEYIDCNIGCTDCTRLILRNENVDFDKSFAIQQIEEKKYEMELKAEHYKKIIKYGIAFCEKVCYTKLSPFSD